jgi:hypothetical protein
MLYNGLTLHNGAIHDSGENVGVDPSGSINHHHFLYAMDDKSYALYQKRRAELGGGTDRIISSIIHTEEGAHIRYSLMHTDKMPNGKMGKSTYFPLGAPAPLFADAEVLTYQP